MVINCFIVFIVELCWCSLGVVNKIFSRFVVVFLMVFFGLMDKYLVNLFKVLVFVIVSLFIWLFLVSWLSRFRVKGGVFGWLVRGFNRFISMGMVFWVVVFIWMLLIWNNCFSVILLGCLGSVNFFDKVINLFMFDVDIFNMWIRFFVVFELVIVNKVLWLLLYIKFVRVWVVKYWLIVFCDFNRVVSDGMVCIVVGVCVIFWFENKMVSRSVFIYVFLLFFILVYFKLLYLYIFSS